MFSHRLTNTAALLRHNVDYMRHENYLLPDVTHNLGLQLLPSQHIAHISALRYLLFGFASLSIYKHNPHIELNLRAVKVTSMVSVVSICSCLECTTPRLAWWVSLHSQWILRPPELLSVAFNMTCCQHQRLAGVGLLRDNEFRTETFSQQKTLRRRDSGSRSKDYLLHI